MQALIVRATDDAWTLVLRWPHRRTVDPATTASSSLRVDARGAFSVVLPDGSRASGAGTIELAVRPMLWEPPRLLVSLERESGARGELTIDHPDPSVRHAITDPTGKGRSCSGALDLSERVGFLELAFRSGGADLVRIRLEVFPSKLDYARDLQLMLTELAAAHPAKAIALLTRTHVRSRLERRSPRSLEERFQLIDTLFPCLERAMRVIARQPHAGLERMEWPRPVERLRRPDGRTLRAARLATRRDVSSQGVQLPRRLPDSHRVPTWDTTPNRYVRSALVALDWLFSKAAARRSDRRGPWADVQLQARIAGHRRRVRRWLAQDFLLAASVRPVEPDLAMERSPGYRDFLRGYRRMLLAYALLGGDCKLDLADLDRLYELWCGTRLEGLLSELLGPPAKVDPPRGKAQSALVFRDGTRFLVKPVVREPDDGPEHEPDFAIELLRPPLRGRGPARFLFLLDAKYRLGWDDNGKPRPMQDAVNAIHRYRDAMVQEEDSVVIREVYGGAILFPHPREEQFAAEQTSAFTRMSKTGIGAIPLTPSGDQTLRAFLAELVHASATRLDRYGPGYRPLPPPRRSGTVLLAHVPYGEPQIEQVLSDGWLHVAAPLSLAVRKPTHVALLERSTSGPGVVRRLLPILDWSEVDGEWVRANARFGEGRAGRRSRYRKLVLGASEALEPVIDGRDWWPRSPKYVPLEVLDLADSTFLLRGDERHVSVIRLVHHLRRVVVGSPSEAWRSSEPILVGRQWVGELQASVAGVAWRIGESQGGCSLADLRVRPIERLFGPLQEAVDRMRGRG